MSHRFWSKVAKSAACWEWTASRGQTGYGKAYKGKRFVAAHRRAWELAFGAIPEGMCVCHTCDNRGCVRPEHLFLATHEQNMADMVRKGRSPDNVGESNPSARLSDDAVRAIRRSDEPRAVLAARYGVTTARIGQIIRRTGWKHVVDELPVDD